MHRLPGNNRENRSEGLLKTREGAWPTQVGKQSQGQRDTSGWAEHGGRTSILIPHRLHCPLLWLQRHSEGR